jgi:uncharacterized protein
MPTDLPEQVENLRQQHEAMYRGAGGTPGGTKMFFIGLVLAAVGLYLFFDSVLVTTRPQGFFSGGFHRLMGGAPGMMQTTSTGIIFAPFFIGIVILFYNSKLMIGWVLFYIGLAILAIEILSRIEFILQTKTSLLLLMLGMIAAGIGLMLRSFRDLEQEPPKQPPMS